METLQQLGTMMGLTMLAGLNLYLTVFVTGLAIRLGWVANYPVGLDVLGDPVILSVAGVLLVLELIADKWAYVDSLWDSAHTVIRPVGGALLALAAIGDVHPVVSVVAVLLGGSIAFTSHAAKAGTRAMVNTSPEPVTNVVASTAENVLVVGGLWLAFQHPLIALSVVLTFVVVFWYFAPKFFRMVRANVTAIVHRFMARRRGATPPGLPRTLPGFVHEAWLKIQRPGEDVAWALPCFAGRIKDVGRNVRGCLIGTSQNRVLFVGRKLLRHQWRVIPAGRMKCADDPGAFFHRLTIRGEDGDEVRVRFTRKYAPHVTEMLTWMDARSRKMPFDGPDTALVGRQK
jgi:hypothetical protein